MPLCRTCSDELTHPTEIVAGQCLPCHFPGPLPARAVRSNTWMLVTSPVPVCSSCKGTGLVRDPDWPDVAVECETCAVVNVEAQRDVLAFQAMQEAVS